MGEEGRGRGGEGRGGKGEGKRRRGVWGLDVVNFFLKFMYIFLLA